MAEMPLHEWVFRARLNRVIDGDTFDVVLDQGMHTLRIERLRLLEFNAPEVRGEMRDAGLRVKRWAEEWFAANAVNDWPLVIQTYKSDVFGRYLAHIWAATTGEDLVEALVQRQREFAAEGST